LAAFRRSLNEHPVHDFGTPPLLTASQAGQQGTVARTEPVDQRTLVLHHVSRVCLQPGDQSEAVEHAVAKFAQAATLAAAVVMLLVLLMLLVFFTAFVSGIDGGDFGELILSGRQPRVQAVEVLKLVQC
jgi:hypothetical protein